jgi:hypothetical protein
VPAIGQKSHSRFRTVMGTQVRDGLDLHRMHNNGARLLGGDAPVAGAVRAGDHVAFVRVVACCELVFIAFAVSGEEALEFRLELGVLPRSWRQALLSLAGGQCGSDGGVRQPRVEAWSTRVRVARATIGRVSSAR